MPKINELLKGLNPQQCEAVRRTDGPVLILAGAGSGKTRVITTRIAYLLGKRLAAPEEILAVTFTNKAAEEMRERVASLVGKQRAKGIVLSTFHSFCLRVLRQEIEHMGYRRNFTISSEGDARTLIRRTLSDMDGAQESFDADTFLSQIGMMKSAGLDAKSPPLMEGDEKDSRAKYRQWFSEVYGRYQSALRAANSLDFDDLLLMTLKLWQEHPRILSRYRKQFRYIMVDEYQDTNGVQYALLKALAGDHRNLCVVGDDDQSIYSWRGADIGNILSFEKDFPEAGIIKLEQNYRSTETVLNAANAVIAHNKARREKRLWSQLGKGRPIDWFIVGNEEDEAKEAARWLKYIQSKSEAKYSDFAILYRSNLQSRPFEITLRQAGIPYSVVGGQEFFERAEIRDIVAYLKVLVNPRDEAAFLRVVNVPRRGIGDTTLHKAHDLCREEGLSLGKALARIGQDNNLQANTKAGIHQFLALLRDTRARFKQCNGDLTASVHELLDQIDYRGDLLRNCKSREQFEARWANVTALLTAVTDYESAARETGQTPSLSSFLDQSALASDYDRQPRDERKKRGVTLMTVHSAKGLEFPFVFIVGLEEGLLPHQKSVGAAAIEEERRLFYVALTRGKRHVTLFECLSRDRYGKRRMSKTSRFLQEVPESLVRCQARAARDMVEASIDQAKPAKKSKKSRPRR